MARKRERLEVIHDILKTVSVNQNKVRPTKLQRVSNLSPQMFKEYLDELLEKRFLESEGEPKYFMLTDKGFEFLSEYKKIIEFIDNFGL